MATPMQEAPHNETPTDVVEGVDQVQTAGEAPAQAVDHDAEVVGHVAVTSSVTEAPKAPETQSSTSTDTPSGFKFDKGAYAEPTPVKPADSKKGNRLLKWGAPLALVGTLAAGAFGLTRGGDDSEPVAPTQKTELSTPQTTTFEERKDTPATTSTITPPVTDPSSTPPLTQPENHSGISDSFGGARSPEVITEQLVGDFQFGLSLKDLEIIGHQAQLCDGKENVYSTTDRNHTVIVRINSESGVIDGIHTEDPGVKTKAGIHVGSTKAEVQQAYGPDVSEKVFTVDGKKLTTLVLEDETHKRTNAQSMFTLNDQGKVASIDAVSILSYDAFNDISTPIPNTGPLVVPESCQ